MVLMLTGVASTAAAQRPMFSAPKDYLLALGDSLTFGFQQMKFQVNPDPSNFTTGFVDDFARRLTATGPGWGTRVVNFGCPGETTSSFLAGPCAYHANFGFALHDTFEGSQIDAVETFLATHPGQVGPILISLGANDTLTAVEACGLDAECISALLPDILAVLVANYGESLARLRAAAPEAEIIVLALYNPFAVLNPTTNLLAAVLNQAIQAVATANRARVANPFVAFNLAQPQPQTLCSLTLFCGPGDIHPSDDGYVVIADLMWIASGYARFEQRTH
jgi:lysophospholipase L1-like esterase